MKQLEKQIEDLTKENQFLKELLTSKIDNDNENKITQIKIITGLPLNIEEVMGTKLITMVLQDSIQLTFEIVINQYVSLKMKRKST